MDSEGESEKSESESDTAVSAASAAWLLFTLDNELKTGSLRRELAPSPPTGPAIRVWKPFKLR
eukprot:154632-Pyramimonas_sp.AAC.1